MKASNFLIGGVVLTSLFAFSACEVEMKNDQSLSEPEIAELSFPVPEQPGGDLPDLRDDIVDPDVEYNTAMTAVGEGDFQLLAGRILTRQEISDLSGVDAAAAKVMRGIQVIEGDDHLFYFLEKSVVDGEVTNNVHQIDLNRNKSQLVFSTKTTDPGYELIGMVGENLVMFDGVDFKLENCDSPWLMAETDVRGYKSFVPTSGTPEIVDFTVPMNVKDAEEDEKASCINAN